MNGLSELETTPLGVEHSRPIGLKHTHWKEEAVLLGQVALPESPSLASPFRSTFGWSQHLPGSFRDKTYQDRVRMARDEVMRSTAGSSFATYSSGFGLAKSRSSPDLAETLLEFPRMRPDGWQKTWMDFARPQPKPYVPTAHYRP